LSVDLGLVVLAHPLVPKSREGSWSLPLPSASTEPLEERSRISLLGSSVARLSAFEEDVFLLLSSRDGGAVESVRRRAFAVESED